MNVLYVTPDLGEGDILRREFSARDPDLRFESTATPHEAIERLEAGTSHYDAVLLELTQVNGEGLSLVRHIRKNNLPVGVVAVASARDDAPSQEVLESGADHVVVKGKEFLPRLPTVLARAVERRTLEARLRAMLETVPVCLMRVAGDGTILAMNIAALDMVEAERAEQMVDGSWYERVVPDTRAACRDFIERASRGGQGSFECQITRLSGIPRTVVLGAVARTRRCRWGSIRAGGDAGSGQDPRPRSGAGAVSSKAGVLETALSEAEATRRPKLVEEHQAERDKLERALKAAAAHGQQLSADHEAERAEWEQELASSKAQEGTLVEQLSTERDKLERRPESGRRARSAARCRP